MSYPELRVEMFRNEFRWGKTKVFQSLGIQHGHRVVTAHLRLLCYAQTRLRGYMAKFEQCQKILKVYLVLNYKASKKARHPIAMIATDPC